MTGYDIWRSTNFYGLIVLTFFICLHFRKQIGWALTLTWFYFLFNALMVFQNPIPKVTNQNMAILLDQISGQAFSQNLVLPLFVLLFPQKLFRYWKIVFLLFGFFEVFSLLAFNYGAMLGHSFDSAMIAAIAPLSTGPVVLAFLLLGIFKVQGATAILMLGGQIIAYFAAAKRRGLLAAGTVCGLVIAAYAVQGSELMNGSGRIQVWTQIFQWWTKQDVFAMGTGTGTFQWIGPHIVQRGNQVYLQMHSDWLQVLFEGGFIGLSLCIWSALFLLRKAYDRPKIFAALVGVFLFALTYHPLRFFPSALFIVCLIREIVGDRPWSAKRFHAS